MRRPSVPRAHAASSSGDRPVDSVTDSTIRFDVLKPSSLPESDQLEGGLNGGRDQGAERTADDETKSGDPDFERRPGGYLPTLSLLDHSHYSGSRRESSRRISLALPRIS